MGENVQETVDALGAPVLIYMANGRIMPLEEMTHTKSVQKKLNQQGLHIFLFEPICSYYDADPLSPKAQILERVARGLAKPTLMSKHYNQVMFNSGFYSEFPNRTVTYRAAELDSILTYIKNNNLENVVVHTCDYDIQEHYKHYTKYMTLLFDDLYLKTASFNCGASTKCKTHFEKKFVSLNWRFTPFRAMIASLLCKKSTHLSWYFTCSEKLLTNTPWLEYQESSTPKLHKRLVMGLDKLNNGAPWCVDFDHPRSVVNHLGENFHSHYYPDPAISIANPSTENNDRMRLSEIYSESFVDIVCETRFAQPTALISEKTIQAIQYLTPFVLVAPPHTLRCVKEFGFRTFDKWWDESYDSETSHVKRLDKIISVIDFIDGLSESEMIQMYGEMRKTLLHNIGVLKKLAKYVYYPKYNPTNPELVQWLPTDKAVKEAK